MGTIKKYRILDKNTGEEVEVTFEEIKPHGTPARASIMEALSEDLYETWNIPATRTNEGVIIEEVEPQA